MTKREEPENKESGSGSNAAIAEADNSELLDKLLDQATAENQAFVEAQLNSQSSVNGSFVSPIAKPILVDGSLPKAFKLIKKIISQDRGAKSVKKGMPGSNKRLVRRGVAEVTKAIRKGEKGIVFLACDIFPIDIVAHIPTLCEEKGVLAVFLGTKRVLGAACRSKRPTSAIMLVTPGSDNPNLESFEKFASSLRKKLPEVA